MAEIGYFLSSEEHGPRQLAEFARMGEEAGFHSVLVSDHYHPWTESQGQSPFVWSVIGAIAMTTSLRVTTGVTCPTMRIHPALIAQATATSSLLLQGRFCFGVGSGEALNEHVVGAHWPPADTRLEMLEEALDVIRRLWEGGFVTHYGRHYTVENARIYSRPEEPPPILMSGFGPKATQLAARIADGYVTTSPDADSLRQYREAGGRGPAVAAAKVCWDPDEAFARKLAFETWRSSGVPGELNQELPMPAHFEQAAEHVTEDMIAQKIVCGPDADAHVEFLQNYIDAGFDEIYISQIGTNQEAFLRFYFSDVLPRVS